MAKTLLDRWQDDEAKPHGGTFLERGLERALGRLAGDAALPEDARQAAKAALAAALTAEIREVLGANRPGAAKAVTPVRSLAPARPFAKKWANLNDFRPVGKIYGELVIDI